ncbi:MAG: sarcosine oxidase subunit gamma [Litorivicinus sp.]
MREVLASPAYGTQELDHGPWTLRLVQDCALASVSSRAERTGELKQALMQQGFEMPFVESFTGNADQGAFWLGPHQVMLWKPYACDPDWAAELDLGEGIYSTEQTDGWVRMDILGEGIAELAQRLINLDPQRLRPGFATRTVIHHIGCYWVVHDNAHSVLVPRSMAASAAHAIEQAMQTVLALR